jgi:membrane-bound lytic murein transglycosylase D
MSADDLHGVRARVHAEGSQSEFRHRPPEELSRSRWLSALLTIPLLATLAAVRPEPLVEQLAAERSAPVVADAVVSGISADMAHRVERWLHAFQTTRREELDKLLARREVYADLILSKLRERGMPEELLYIAVIESGLSPLAVSRVSAVGLWQFMAPTAEQYGLRVDAYVDERRDPEAATDAALDYLAWLHHRFGGSWTLAAAAFNAGPGRVEGILNRHAEGGGGGDDLYWEVLEYLPLETREYVPKMMAVTRLAYEADALGLASGEYEPYRYDTVFLPGGMSLEAVAGALGLQPSTLRVLNPHLIRGVTPPAEIYGVRVPVGLGTAAVRRLDAVAAPRPAAD